MDQTLGVLAGVESRVMGEQERLLHYIHRYGALLAVTVLHIRGPLDAALVRRGLDHIQRRHPLLRAHIRYRKIGFRKLPPYIVFEPEFVLAGTEPIPLVESEGDWQKVMRKELSTPLPKGRNPRLRAVLVKAGAEGIAHLILTADHCIGDAQAAALGARDLMAFFAGPGQPTPLPTGLPPALETVYPRKPDRGAKPYEPAIRLPRAHRAGPRETALEVRRFDAAETAAIRADAKAHRTTMHGVLAAALLSAIHTQYRLPVMTMISTAEFRRLGRPPLPAQTYGCYIDILRTRHTLGGAFWALAQEVAFKLIATLAKDQESASVMKLPNLDVYRHEMLPMMRSGYRLDGLGLTTAGETGLVRNYGAFTLEDITLVVAVHVVGPGIFAASFEREGALTLGLSYGAQTLSTAEVSELADRAAKILRSLPA